MRWQLLLFAALVVSAYTLFVLKFPEKLDVKFAPVGGWDVDSGSYFGFTQRIVGEEGQHFDETVHRPVYPALVALPYALTHSKQAMLVPVFLTAIGLPYVVFLFLKQSGISEETSIAVAVLLLFSRVFAFYGAVAMAEIPALFFGILAMLLWKKGDSVNSALMMCVAILTRETNLVFLGAVVAEDLLKKKFKLVFVLPLILSLLLVGSYAKFFTRAHIDYAKGVPEDTMSFGERIDALGNTFLATFGIVTLFSILGWSGSVSMNVALVLNALMQLSWESVHKRFWFPAFLPVLYFAAKWLDKRSTAEKAVAIGFVMLADAAYSVVPGALAAIF